MKFKEKIWNKKFLIVVLSGILIFAAGIIVGAQTTDEAGSIHDPFITKSYLDKRLEGFDGTGSSSSYEKVTLSKGKVLIGKEGTEILLYQGNGVAYSTYKGIVNVTVGELVGNGITLGKYCVYVSPDSESGIKAESDMILFVKGAYSTN